MSLITFEAEIYIFKEYFYDIFRKSLSRYFVWTLYTIGVKRPYQFRDRIVKANFKAKSKQNPTYIFVKFCSKINCWVFLIFSIKKKKSILIEIITFQGSRDCKWLVLHRSENQRKYLERFENKSSQIIFVFDFISDFSIEIKSFRKAKVI